MDNFDFSLARVPKPVSVLRVNLRPFAIGHRLLLERMGSPFVVGGTCTLQDLMFAVLVCSHTFEDATNFHKSWTLPLIIKVWALRFKKLDIGAEIQTFRDYLLAGSSCPEIKKENGAGRSPGGPYLLRLVEFLKRTQGKKESDAWNYPLALAQWEWATHFETEGGLKIKNDDERYFDAECARLDALEGTGV